MHATSLTHTRYLFERGFQHGFPGAWLALTYKHGPEKEPIETTAVIHDDERTIT